MIHGALLGDFVKGPLRGDFSPATERGIALHRRIDGFSNRDAELQQLIRKFPADLQRYGGIITDVIFDHFLSIHWQRFHDISLEEFADGIYAHIDQSNVHWPKEARLFSQRLIQHDLLNNYRNWKTIEGVLSSIGARLSRSNSLDRAAVLVRPQFDTMESVFLGTYPRIELFARELRRSGTL